MPARRERRLSLSLRSFPGWMAGLACGGVRQGERVRRIAVAGWIACGV
jgi:hypothetical protein